MVADTCRAIVLNRGLLNVWQYKYRVLLVADSLGENAVTMWVVDAGVWQ
jgi:hypothetical protein